MSVAPPLIAFEDASFMVERLAQLIALQLQTALAQRGRALFAVSGGSTPAHLHAALSKCDLDWRNVTVAPVDERWVDADHAGSNETFIRRTLLQNKASLATLFRVKTEHALPAEGAAQLDAELRDIAEAPDAVVFGMGPDGHTASWFPHCDGLAPAIARDGEATLVGIRAKKSEVTGDLLDRITMTASYVRHAPLKILLLQGEGKRDTYRRASEAGAIEDMPVRALFRDASDLWTAWAP
jgi:6-phosphogluconolactonase